MAVTLQDDTEHELKVAITAVTTRLEQHGMLIQRLSDRMDVSDRDREYERKRVDSAPAGYRGWMVIAISIAALCLSGLCGGVSLLVSIWQASHP